MQLKIFPRVLVCAIAMTGALPAQLRMAHVPMTFHGDSKAIRTSACLQVSERVYSAASSPWNGFGADTDAAEKAFEAVVAAMRSGDRGKLFELSDPAQAKDSAEFDAQAGAFFKQFQTLQLVSVPRSYRLDGLAVFFGSFQSKGKTIFAPLVFAAQPDGAFRFLPKRTEQLSYVLLKDWFQAEWGPAKTATPIYCGANDIKQATHRVPLIEVGRTEAANPSVLLLRGAPLQKQNEPSVPGGRAITAVAELKVALAQPGIEPASKLLTGEGASRLKEWFATANSDERKNYKDAVVEQEPFFYFDASPLTVVYTRSTVSKAIQVMYFTPGAANRLVWTNASHVTVADQVFKRGLLWSSAASAAPFSEVAAK